MPITDYVDRQKNSGLCVGDRVVVLRSAISREDGWDNSWAGDPMDCSVGKEYSIQDITGDSGIGLDDGFHYPYFVLGPISNNIFASINIGDAYEYQGMFIVIEFQGGLLYRCRMTTQNDLIHSTLIYSAGTINTLMTKLTK